MITLVLFYALSILSMWLAFTRFDIISDITLLKISKSVATIGVLLIILKMNHDRGKTSLLTSALTVGSLLLVYELGVLIGLIPLAILTMVSGEVRKQKDLGNVTIELDDLENICKTVIVEDEENWKISFAIHEDWTWDSFKEELTLFYKKEGFVLAVIDKEGSWMLKRDKADKAYIYMKMDNEIITIETYNAKKPDVPILNEVVSQAMKEVV